MIDEVKNSEGGKQTTWSERKKGRRVVREGEPTGLWGEVGDERVTGVTARWPAGAVSRR